MVKFCAVIFAVLLIYILLVLNFEVTCNDAIVSTIVSPSGMQKAVVLVRSCGATVEDAYHIQVRGRDDSTLSHDGIVFTAVISDDNTKQPTVRWVSDEQMHIMADSLEPIYLVKEYFGISIDCEAK